ncbi:GalE family epimerase/dehydratase [Natrialba magadii ATCC 43099]|uniref:GalE family epimerase/dehydratase n=1 Tax=Natrialba magadii (strain ATCC 43099 / DSM 3394 / CCM 3739 / CIP 104546 / IAM 13178 / JCM 8861 / NBRC 102185 / NCIMB 2190 / MS3) TaxID=547559 RepID=D3SXN0_NATMM|nr:NAD(P)-dependent oxidoreductase [Natrialba magadii]ADD05979.1 GalE family epimerase/dehydratase [Natrialba magadii ATCC 43099]ELY30512.1 NAD-dependent epimerase/dehydratase [Natrialba magadii ATCC 43099]
MKIVVTGATGGVGSWLVDHFAAAGHDVLGLDLDRPPRERENATFLAADLTDQGQAWDAILSFDPDAVVHFAAIPRVGIEPDAETFLTNVTSTYHVLEAAGQAGADVVWASSESIYGAVFAAEPWLPEYFPVDEDHPRRPEDPYATSKLVGEDIAAMTARKHDVSVTSIRPSWVTFPGEQQTAAARDQFDPETAEPNGNFWTYVDVRDVVSIVDAALENASDGHETYLAVAAENFLDRPTAETIETVFGDLPEECALEGDESAFSSAKARAELEWEPTHSWRDAEGEPASGPSFVDR